MDTQDSGKDVSENFFQELFKEESPDRSEPPISLDQEASVSFARDLFSQNLEDAARIMKLKRLAKKTLRLESHAWNFSLWF